MTSTVRHVIVFVMTDVATLARVLRHIDDQISAISLVLPEPWDGEARDAELLRITHIRLSELEARRGVVANALARATDASATRN